MYVKHSILKDIIFRELRFTRFRTLSWECWICGREISQHGRVTTAVSTYFFYSISWLLLKGKNQGIDLRPPYSGDASLGDALQPKVAFAYPASGGVEDFHPQ